MGLLLLLLWSESVFRFAKSKKFSRTTATVYLKISSSSSSSFFLLAAMLITSASFCSSNSGLSLRTTIPRSWASRPAEHKQTKQSFIGKTITSPQIPAGVFQNFHRRHANSWLKVQLNVIVFLKSRRKANDCKFIYKRSKFLALHSSTTKKKTTRTRKCACTAIVTSAKRNCARSVS